MILKNGSQLQNGRYRIENVLGQGGFGITYLAEQSGLGRKVAIKEFYMKEHCNRDEATSYVSVPSVGSRELVERFRHKFQKEANLIASFNNRHIIKVYDVFEENGTAYYVMEYLEGGNLETLVNSRGCLGETSALSYIHQIAEALAEVHSRKHLHLDVKPVNIMLDSNGDAVLIDFGISKHYDDDGSQTSSGLVCLSEGYAPLEQYKKGGISLFSPATDIYSLGATLYKMLTGQRPPHATDVNDDGLPAFAGHVSAHVRRAVEAAMQPRRKDRPQSVEEFVALLSSAVVAGRKPGNGETVVAVAMSDETENRTEIVSEAREVVADTAVPWPELKYQANHLIGGGISQGGHLRITGDRIYFKPHAINQGPLEERYIEIKDVVGYKKGKLTFMSIFTADNKEMELAVWKKDEIISEIEKRRAAVFSQQGLPLPPLKFRPQASSGCLGVLVMIAVGVGTAMYSIFG